MFGYVREDKARGKQCSHNQTNCIASDCMSWEAEGWLCDHEEDCPAGKLVKVQEYHWWPECKTVPSGPCNCGGLYYGSCRRD